MKWNKLAREQLKAQAQQAIDQRIINVPLLQYQNSVQSKIDSFLIAFPSGIAAMNSTNMNTIGLNTNYLASKFMSETGVASYVLAVQTAQDTLSNTMGNLREMTYFTTKSLVDSATDTAKTEISNAFLSALSL